MIFSGTSMRGKRSNKLSSFFFLVDFALVGRRAAQRPSPVRHLPQRMTSEQIGPPEASAQMPPVCEIALRAPLARQKSPSCATPAPTIEDHPPSRLYEAGDLRAASSEGRTGRSRPSACPYAVHERARPSRIASGRRRRSSRAQNARGYRGRFLPCRNKTIPSYARPRRAAGFRRDCASRTPRHRSTRSAAARMAHRH